MSNKSHDKHYNIIKDKYLNKKINYLQILDVVRKQQNVNKCKTGIYFVCECDCGNIKEIINYEVLNGKVMSCGCFHKEEISKNALKYQSYNNYRKYDWYFIKDGQKIR